MITITGTVMYGKQLGRTIGFPTANIALDFFEYPYGVYISKITVSSKQFFGITNIGTKPTVDNHSEKITCETHIFSFNEDIYNLKVHVELLHFIRNERKFDSIGHLTSQILKDIDFSRNYLRLKEEGSFE